MDRNNPGQNSKLEASASVPDRLSPASDTAEVG